MNLKAYDRATQEAIIAAGQDRELFTLSGNGVSVDYLIKSTIIQCDHQGEYVYAELTQVSDALLTPPEETPTTWRGPEDGLPPVGLEVEVLWSSLKGEYVTGKVLAHDEGRAVYRFTSGERKGEYQADGCFFSMDRPPLPICRPIRTPEQIKAEQREKAVAKLAAVIRDSGWKSPEILAAYLDSQGYCKFEIVDEQP